MYSDIFLKNKSITEYQVHIHNYLSRAFKNNNIDEIVLRRRVGFLWTYSVPSDVFELYNLVLKVEGNEM